MSLYWFYSAYISKSRKEEKRSRRWEKWGEKAEALWLALGKHGGGGAWGRGMDHRLGTGSPAFREQARLVFLFMKV